MSSSSPLRAANVERLPQGVHDVLIVGGGINGAVCAAALAARGARVALVDRSDFASFTSQESSNLVWGGIKYLENWEFGLVRKLCRSRNELCRAYPANVREIRFYAPIERRPQGFKRTLPVLWAGTWLYWLIGNAFTRAPRRLSVRTIAREEPCVDTSIVRGGIEYSDAYLLDNDARFVFGFVRTALKHGGTLANYVEVLGSEWDPAEPGAAGGAGAASGLWTTQAIDRVSGEQLAIRSRVLVNAAGPHVDQLNQGSGIATAAHHVFSKGIHLVVDRLTEKPHVLTFFDDTDRMFFVIPMGHRSAIGTTDTRVERPETEVTEEDREFLLHNINKRLRLATPLRRADVISERCGVRPLAVEGGGSAQHGEWVSMSRKHVIEVDRDRRHVSIFGGKLTDCLNVGDSVAREVADLGIELPTETERWYGEPSKALHADFLAEAAGVGLDRHPAGGDHEPLSTRLWRRYGTGAFGLLEEIGRDPGMAEPVIEGTEYRRCELRHAARSEMVVNLEDFLRRRSKIALVERRERLLRAAGLMEACEILFGAAARERYDEYFAG